MKSKITEGAVIAGLVVACTTNTTVVREGRAGGAACDYDSECASSACTGGKGAAPPTSSSGEQGVQPSEDGVRPLGTCAAASTSGGSSSGASGATSDSGTTGGGACGRAPYGSSDLTCADCTALGPGYRCAAIKLAPDCTTCDETTYCYHPCTTDADCACDSYAPTCRTNSTTGSSLGTMCMRRQ